MKRLSVLALALFVVLAFALPSEAVSPLRLGQKSFERGWNKLSYNDREAAAEQFIVGADAFAEALAEDPRSRAAGYYSNLTRAGMTFYFAGRYQEAIDVLKEAYDLNSKAWESALYTAMSYASLGDGANARQWLKKFLDMHSGQRTIANEAIAQIEALESGATTAEAAAKALDESVVEQIRRNTQTLSRKAAFAGDGCRGTYWWRHARKPCLRRGGFID